MTSLICDPDKANDDNFVTVISNHRFKIPEVPRLAFESMTR